MLPKVRHLRLFYQTDANNTALRKGHLARVYPQLAFRLTRRTMAGSATKIDGTAIAKYAIFTVFVVAVFDSLLFLQICSRWSSSPHQGEARDVPAISATAGHHSGRPTPGLINVCPDESEGCRGSWNQVQACRTSC